MCQLRIIALLSTGNFKLAQQISYGHVSALATDVGTISKLFAMGCVTLVLGYNGKNSLRPRAAPSDSDYYQPQYPRSVL